MYFLLGIPSHGRAAASPAAQAEGRDGVEGWSMGWARNVADQHGKHALERARQVADRAMPKNGLDIGIDHGQQVEGQNDRASRVPDRQALNAAPALPAVPLLSASHSRHTATASDSTWSRSQARSPNPQALSTAAESVTGK